MSATAQMVADNWKAAMTSGTAAAKYKAAISNVQVNPMELAAAAVDSGKYLAGVQASIASGKMQKKLRNASVAMWKNNALTAGVTNLTSGATKGYPKMQAASATIAAAGAAAKAAAAAASGPLAKVAAAINAVRAAHGYGSIA